MSRKRLPDNEACRRILANQRRYHKNIKCKYITEPIFKINGWLLSLTCHITYNLKTDRLSISEDFIYKRRLMLQSPRKVLKCNTKEGIRYLQEQRKMALEWYYENKRKKLQSSHNKMIEKK